MTAIQERGGAPFYAPQGRMASLWDCRGVGEVMIAGPAGTGKSRGILEYLYVLASLHPKLRILIARLTRKSLTETTLVTFEDEVVPGRPPWLTNQKRRVRQAYELPNGSEIVCGGLDDTAKIMSSQYDVIYIPEAREAGEAAWEDLMSRLRNGRLPWQQIIGDTNPDGPAHWILRRAASGSLKLIETRHDDNPRYWDAARGEWTDEGRAYVTGTLEQLTGVRYKRLRLGLWVGAENLIYDLWDPAIHVIDPFELPDEWPRFRAIDFGFTNPFSCLWGALDEDHRLFIYREAYGTQRLVRDWAHLLHDLSGQERYQVTVTDHDIEGRDDLESHLGHSAAQCRVAGINGPASWTTAATKDVLPGIERVSQRMKRAGDGDPRIFVFRNALVERDPLLVDAKRPCGLLDEMPRYVWRKVQSQSAGEVLLEEPLKQFDHSLDALRYMVMQIDHPLANLGEAMGQGMSYGGQRQPTRTASRGAARGRR